MGIDRNKTSNYRLVVTATDFRLPHDAIVLTAKHYYGIQYWRVCGVATKAWEKYRDLGYSELHCDIHEIAENKYI